MNRSGPRLLAQWRARHQSGLSLWLHLLGIPLVVAGLALALVQLCLWRWDLWWRPALLVAAGYALQIIGHRHEGNDVGEWLLVKRLLGRPGIAVSPKYQHSADGRPTPGPRSSGGRPRRAQSRL